MQYDKEIFKVLVEAGEEGLSVRKITRHVFNASNSMFDIVHIEDVHRYISSFLIRQSKSNDSFIERADMRGVYRLNMKSCKTKQLMIDFKNQDTTAEDNISNTQTDQSLSLF